jgi:hypothetical protein
VPHLIEPAAAGAPIVLTQPLIRPQHLALHDAACSSDQLA